MGGNGMRNRLGLGLDTAAMLLMGACGNGESEGEEDQIVVVSREEGSSTRSAFKEILSLNTEEANGMRLDVVIRDGNGVVATHTQAIGYLSFATLAENADELKGVRIKEVQETPEKVLNNTYPLSRPFNLVYQEEHLAEVDRAFIAFLTSMEGLGVLEVADTFVDYNFNWVL